MLTLGIVLSLVGLVISLAAGIQLLVVIFRTSGAVWGLGSLLLPVVSLIWLFGHWKEGKSAFLRSLAGGALYGVGAALSAAAMHS